MVQTLDCLVFLAHSMSNWPASMVEDDHGVSS